ncbi:MAG: hypothetical protein ACU0GG_02785 [Paracoccaceae bacterium]
MHVYAFNFVLLSVVYSLTFILIAWRLWKNLAAGGDLYQQGSWLISFDDGLVRRGIAGEALQALSDLTGLSLMIVLGVVQISALALVMAMLFPFAVRSEMASRVTLLLLSPCLVLFWFNDQYAPLRMEILAYLAFVPLFLGPRPAVSKAQVVLSLSLFAIAVAFFEVNAAFAVPLAIVLYIRLGPGRAMGPIFATGVIALLGAVFAVVFLTVPGTEGMCARAVAAGASPTVCDGLMPWMAKDFATIRHDWWHEFMEWGGLQRSVSAVLTVIVLFGCLFTLVRPAVRDRQAMTYLGLCVLAFAPFYALGSDWGRWFSAQVFAALFVVMALDLRGRATQLRTPLSMPVYTTVLGIHLGVGMFHMVPFALPGFVFSVLEAVQNALR